MRLLMLALLIVGGPLAAQTRDAAPRPPAPVDSMLVRPGMVQAAVVAAWGRPSGTRTRGDYTYLFYANDCKPSCGMQDVVILERGQVVDAIARAPRHRYDGISSSPAGRTPGYTPAPPARSTPTPSPPR